MPPSVTAACVHSTPNRVTGCASTISIVPRFSFAAYRVRSRDTPHVVTSNSTIGSSYATAILPADVAILPHRGPAAAARRNPGRKRASTPGRAREKLPDPHPQPMDPEHHHHAAGQQPARFVPRFFPEARFIVAVSGRQDRWFNWRDIDRRCPARSPTGSMLDFGQGQRGQPTDRPESSPGVSITSSPEAPMALVTCRGNSPATGAWGRSFGTDAVFAEQIRYHLRVNQLSAAKDHIESHTCSTSEITCDEKLRCAGPPGFPTSVATSERTEGSRLEVGSSRITSGVSTAGVTAGASF